MKSNLVGCEVAKENPNDSNDAKVFENSEDESPGKNVESEYDHRVRHDVQQHGDRWLRVCMHFIPKDIKRPAGCEGEREIRHGHADDLGCGEPAGAQNDVQLGQ